MILTLVYDVFYFVLFFPLEFMMQVWKRRVKGSGNGARRYFLRMGIYDDMSRTTVTNMTNALLERRRLGVDMGTA